MLPATSVHCHMILIRVYRFHAFCQYQCLCLKYFHIHTLSHIISLSHMQQNAALLSLAVKESSAATLAG